jgi:MFS family permease
VTNAARWRWVFYLNLPLGVIALAGLVAYLPADRAARGPDHAGWAVIRRIDVAGAVLSAAATLALLLGLTWGGTGAGWTAWGTPRVVGALGGATLLYGALLVAERHAVAPIMPLGLFHDRVFAATATLSLLLNMALLGMAFYVPLFLQGVLGVTATQAGVTMTPFSVGIAVASSLAGPAISALKRYQGLALLGAALMALGLFLVTRLSPTTTLGAASLAVTLTGVGMGALFAVVGVVALNAVPPAQMGASAGAVRYLGQIGGTIGVALVATVVNSTLAGTLDRHLPHTALRRLAADGVTVASNPQILANPTYRASVTRRAIMAATAHLPAGSSHARRVAATQQAQHLVAQVFDALRLALAEAIQRGLVVPLVVAVLAVLAAAFLRDRPMGRPPDQVA